MDLFKKKEEKEKTTDVKLIRDGLLQAIKEQLSRAEGGEGGNIRGVHLFLYPKNDERYLYEAAVYLNEEGKFKEDEVQRLADNFALDLPADWTLELTLVDALPPEAMKVPDLDAGLFIRTQKRSILKSATAYIKVLNGEAEKEVYIIESGDKRINIGRETKVQSDDGFFRINNIAFPAESQHESNKFISRQHAHIEFENDSGQFLLFADEGGIPPRNKIKVRSINDDAPVKLYSTRIAHALAEGDQIMIGESAILEFSYSQI